MSFTLNESDLLTKVSKYELNRGENDRVFIDVHEVIGGQANAKFIAIPNLVLRSARSEYFGRGGAETEALENCLKLIKDVKSDVIIKLDDEKD